MKKVMMVMLVVALIMSMAIPAFAVSSPTATAAAPAGPAVGAPACGCGTDTCGCKVVSWAQRNILSAEKKATFEEAKTSLKDAVPEGFVARNIVYVLKGENCTSCTMTMTANGVETVAAKQYVDGAWAEKSVSLAGGTATISDVVEGPLAIFTK